MGHVVRLPENGRRRPVRAARFTGKGNAASPENTPPGRAKIWRAHGGKRPPRLQTVGPRRQNCHSFLGERQQVADFITRP
ncbi:hypothetical protein ANDA3_0651 [plant metagenome]|uniref:Uncharacterized protein n=1 Tax=plant metagenome TaxID=1297885 RepID=A0A484TEV0_9ZZZZ